MKAHIHSQSLCESTDIGNGTRVGAFTHIFADAKIGIDCTIAGGIVIEAGVILGDRVSVAYGVQLCTGIFLEDDVHIGPNATFSTEFRRRETSAASPARTVVEKGAFIGANATILPGVRIGSNAMIGAGAVVTKSVPPHAIAVGNPARITGYTGAQTLDAGPTTQPQAEGPPVRKSRVKGVELRTFKAIHDMRGNLTVGEFEREIPFTPKRYFFVYDVPTAEVRGEHAHKHCHQYLVAVNGAVHVVADDGKTREQFVLDKPNLGLYLPPMTWGIQYKYSSDAGLLVFASHLYDADDYIRDYSRFLEMAKASDS